MATGDGEIPNHVKAETANIGDHGNDTEDQNEKDEVKEKVPTEATLTVQEDTTNSLSQEEPATQKTHEISEEIDHQEEEPSSDDREENAEVTSKDSFPLENTRTHPQHEPSCTTSETHTTIRENRETIEEVKQGTDSELSNKDNGQGTSKEAEDITSNVETVHTINHDDQNDSTNEADTTMKNDPEITAVDQEKDTEAEASGLIKDLAETDKKENKVQQDDTSYSQKEAEGNSAESTESEQGIGTKHRENDKEENPNIAQNSLNLSEESTDTIDHEERADSQEPETLCQGRQEVENVAQETQTESDANGLTKNLTEQHKEELEVKQEDTSDSQEKKENTHEGLEVKDDAQETQTESDATDLTENLTEHHKEEIEVKQEDTSDSQEKAEIMFEGHEVEDVTQERQTESDSNNLTKNVTEVTEHHKEEMEIKQEEASDSKEKEERTYEGLEVKDVSQEKTEYATELTENLTEYHKEETKVKQEDASDSQEKEETMYEEGYEVEDVDQKMQTESDANDLTKNSTEHHNEELEIKKEDTSDSQEKERMYEGLEVKDVSQETHIESDATDLTENSTVYHKKETEVKQEDASDSQEKAEIMDEEGHELKDVAEETQPESHATDLPENLTESHKEETEVQLEDTSDSQEKEDTMYEESRQVNDVAKETQTESDENDSTENLTECHKEETEVKKEETSDPLEKEERIYEKGLEVKDTDQETLTESDVTNSTENLTEHHKEETKAKQEDTSDSQEKAEIMDEEGHEVKDVAEETQPESHATDLTENLTECHKEETEVLQEDTSDSHEKEDITYEGHQVNDVAKETQTESDANDSTENLTERHEEETEVKQEETSDPQEKEERIYEKGLEVKDAAQEAQTESDATDSTENLTEHHKEETEVKQEDTSDSQEKAEIMDEGHEVKDVAEETQPESDATDLTENLTESHKEETEVQQEDTSDSQEKEEIMYEEGHQVNDVAKETQTESDENDTTENLTEHHEEETEVKKEETSDPQEKEERIYENGLEVKDTAQEIQTESDATNSTENLTEHHKEETEVNQEDTSDSQEKAEIMDEGHEVKDVAQETQIELDAITDSHKEEIELKQEDTSDSQEKEERMYEGHEVKDVAQELQTESDANNLTKNLVDGDNKEIELKKEDTIDSLEKAESASVECLEVDVVQEMQPELDTNDLIKNLAKPEKEEIEVKQEDTSDSQEKAERTLAEGLEVKDVSREMQTDIDTNDLTKNMVKTDIEEVEDKQEDTSHSQEKEERTSGEGLEVKVVAQEMQIRPEENDLTKNLTKPFKEEIEVKQELASDLEERAERTFAEGLEVNDVAQEMQTEPEANDLIKPLAEPDKEEIELKQEYTRDSQKNSERTSAEGLEVKDVAQETQTKPDANDLIQNWAEPDKEEIEAKQESDSQEKADITSAGLEVKDVVQERQMELDAIDLTKNLTDANKEEILLKQEDTIDSQEKSKRTSAEGLEVEDVAQQMQIDSDTNDLTKNLAEPDKEKIEDKQEDTSDSQENADNRVSAKSLEVKDVAQEMQAASDTNDLTKNLAEPGKEEIEVKQKDTSDSQEKAKGAEGLEGKGIEHGETEEGKPDIVHNSLNLSELVMKATDHEEKIDWQGGENAINKDHQESTEVVEDGKEATSSVKGGEEDKVDVISANNEVEEAETEFGSIDSQERGNNRVEETYTELESIDIQVNTSSGIKDVIEEVHSILEEKQDQRNEEDRTEKINEESTTIIDDIKEATPRIDGGEDIGNVISTNNDVEVTQNELDSIDSHESGSSKVEETYTELESISNKEITSRGGKDVTLNEVVHGFPEEQLDQRNEEYITEKRNEERTTTDDRKEATPITDGGQEYIRDVISTKNEVQETPTEVGDIDSQESGNIKVKEMLDEKSTDQEAHNEFDSIDNQENTTTGSKDFKSEEVVHSILEKQQDQRNEEVTTDKKIEKSTEVVDERKETTPRTNGDKEDTGDVISTNNKVEEPQTELGIIDNQESGTSKVESTTIICIRKEDTPSSNGDDKDTRDVISTNNEVEETQIELCSIGSQESESRKVEKLEIVDDKKESVPSSNDGEEQAGDVISTNNKVQEIQTEFDNESQENVHTESSNIQETQTEFQKTDNQENTSSGSKDVVSEEVVCNNLEGQLDHLNQEDTKEKRNEEVGKTDLVSLEKENIQASASLDLPECIESENVTKNMDSITLESSESPTSKQEDKPVESDVDKDILGYRIEEQLNVEHENEITTEEVIEYNGGSLKKQNLETPASVDLPELIKANDENKTNIVDAITPANELSEISVSKEEDNLHMTVVSDPVKPIQNPEVTKESMQVEPQELSHVQTAGLEKVTLLVSDSTTDDITEGMIQKDDGSDTLVNSSLVEVILRNIARKEDGEQQQQEKTPASILMESSESNKTINEDESSEAIICNQVVAEAVTERNEEIAPLEHESSSKLEITDTTHNEEQQTLLDLPVSQFLLDRILKENSVGESGVTIMNGEKQDIGECNISNIPEGAISDIKPDKQVNPDTNMSSDTVECKDEPSSNISIPEDGQHENVNEKAKNENQKDENDLVKESKDFLVNEEFVESSDNYYNEKTTEVDKQDGDPLDENETSKKNTLNTIKDQDQHDHVSKKHEEENYKDGEILFIHPIVSIVGDAPTYDNHDTQEKILYPVAQNGSQPVEQETNEGTHERSLSTTKEQPDHMNKKHEEEEEEEEDSNNRENLATEKGEVLVGEKPVKSDNEIGETISKLVKCSFVPKELQREAEEVAETEASVIDSQTDDMHQNRNHENEQNKLLESKTSNHDTESDGMHQSEHVNAAELESKEHKSDVKTDDMHQITEINPESKSCERELDTFIPPPSEETVDAPPKKESTEEELQHSSKMKADDVDNLGGNVDNNEVSLETEKQEYIEKFEKVLTESLAITNGSSECKGGQIFEETSMDASFSVPENTISIEVKDQKDDNLVQSEVITAREEAMDSSAEETTDKTMGNTLKKELSSNQPSTAIHESLKDQVTNNVLEGEVATFENDDISKKKSELVTKEEKTASTKEDKIFEEHIAEYEIDTPLMVEIRGQPKSVNKKHQNKLSEVGSKMKHSIISKVKKAITCTSSNLPA